MDRNLIRGGEVDGDVSAAVVVQDGALLADPGAGGQGLDAGSLDCRLESEVEVVEGDAGR